MPPAPTLSLAAFSALLHGVYRLAPELQAHAFEEAALQAVVAVCKDHPAGLLEVIEPHLMQAMLFNRLLHLQDTPPDLRGWRIGIADHEGRLHHGDAGLRQLLADEWPHSQGDRLPASLLQLLQGPDDCVVGERVVVHRRPEKELLLLKVRPRHAVDLLTARELQVARMLAAGHTHKQIAAALGRSPETVRSQVKSAFHKLRINNVMLLPALLALRP